MKNCVGKWCQKLCAFLFAATWAFGKMCGKKWAFYKMLQKAKLFGLYIGQQLYLLCEGQSLTPHFSSRTVGILMCHTFYFKGFVDLVILLSFLSSYVVFVLQGA